MLYSEKLPQCSNINLCLRDIFPTVLLFTVSIGWKWQQGHFSKTLFLVLLTQGAGSFPPAKYEVVHKIGRRII